MSAYSSISTAPGRHSQRSAIYIEQGDAAAREYCSRVVDSLENKIERLGEVQKLVSHCSQLTSNVKALISSYREKQGRYKEHTYGILSKDGLEGMPDMLLPTQEGRAEPGLSPFNSRRFDCRYRDLKSLNAFFDKKTDRHFECQKIIALLLNELDASDPNVSFLKGLEEYHNNALGKWIERKKQAGEHPERFLLPGGKNPFDVIWAKGLHDIGLTGKGAEAVIVERGVDAGHEALQRQVREGSKISAHERAKHGTHVAGIVAQMAPECSVLVREKVESGQHYHGQIVNYSRGEQAPFLGLIANVDTVCFGHYIMCIAQEMASLDFAMRLLNLMQAGKEERMKGGLELFDQIEKTDTTFKKGLSYVAETFSEGGLLVVSNGNEGVVLEDSLLWKKQEKSIDRLKERTIRVVNLDEDGLLPHPSASLPGSDYADITVCAPGTNIMSSVPGGEYKKMTGSSMAAPFVTGLALLLRSAFPELSPQEIRTCILESAQPILLDEQNWPFLLSGPEDLVNYSPELIAKSRRLFGRGRVDAERAYDFAFKLVRARS